MFEILGITRRAAEEFTTPNIQAFNEVCPITPGVDYYSIGAWKDGAIMNPLLKMGFDIIIGRKFGDSCDGLVRDSEAHWGKYLLSFNNDHFEMLGF